MSYLYVSKCNTYYKIGITTDLESRLAELQVGNPYPISFCLTVEFGNPSGAEKALHEKFKKQRIRGEWFALTRQDIQAIMEICSLLGGAIINQEVLVSEEDLELAEMDEEIAIGKPRSDSILNALGHRLEISGHGSYKGRYFVWRRPGDRAVMARGLVEDLPDDIKKKLESRANNSCSQVNDF